MKIPSLSWIANDVKVQKKLLGKGQIQKPSGKLWCKDEVKGVTTSCLGLRKIWANTPGILKVKKNKSLCKKLKGVL